MKEEVMQELAALQSLQWPEEHKQIYGHMNPFIEKNLRVLVQRTSDGLSIHNATMQQCEITSIGNEDEELGRTTPL